MPFTQDQSNQKSRSERSIRIARHSTSDIDQSQAKFPRIEECAHFHYESVSYGSIKLSFVEESPNKSPSNRFSLIDQLSYTYSVRISCKNKSWVVRRSVLHFHTLDMMLHECVFDRKYTGLPVLQKEDLKSRAHTKICSLLQDYLGKLSEITSSNSTGNEIFCAPVLHWLEIDNLGRNLVSHALGDVADINIPAIAAARVVRRYQAQDENELSLNVGDMVSIIEMNTTGWWRGKQGLKVGSFPSQCVKRISSATDIVGTHQQPFTPTSNTAPQTPIGRKHGRFMVRLRSFLDTRPSKSLLKKKGILRERVFGCDIGELLHRTNEEVPAVVADCTKYIEKHGIVDGIYRISGVASHIRHLKYEFDSDRRPDLENGVEGLPELSTNTTQPGEKVMCDPHSIAGLLKLFFRELPNPLLTYQLYNRFASAVSDFEAEERLLKVHDTIQQLPPPHYRTLKHLITHLRHMAQQAKQTSMHCRNLAIVWAPNLLRSREIEAGLAAFTEARVQSVVSEFLIVNGDLLFSEKLQTMQYDAVNRPPRPRSLMILPTPKLISLEEAQARSKCGIVSPVFVGNTSPQQPGVKMRDWNEKTSERRKRRQKKSTSTTIVYNSNQPHPTRSQRKQGHRQIHSVYEPNFSFPKPNEDFFRSLSIKPNTPQGWKGKLGNFLKKSTPTQCHPVARQTSLRRTKSDDSLLSSHSSHSQFRDPTPFDHQKTSSERQKQRPKSEDSDRSRPEPQVPHFRLGPPSPVRLRKKSKSPKKSPKLRSRPSGVVYSDNDEVERKESFQITFRKVTPRNTSNDSLSTAATTGKRTSLDPLLGSSLPLSEQSPSPNPFSEFSCDLPDIMGEDGLDFDPLSYRPSRQQSPPWHDVVVPPYVPTDEDQATPQSLENPNDGKLRSQTAPSERPTISVSVKRVESVRSAYGEPVFAAVSSLMPTVIGNPEENPIVHCETEENEVTEQTDASDTIEHFSNLHTAEPTLLSEDDSDRKSESSVFESTPTYGSQPEPFSANQNSNNNWTQINELNGRAFDGLTADSIAALRIASSPPPRRRSAAELLGLDSKSARAYSTEVKRLSLKGSSTRRENAYYNEVQCQKHTETFVSADTADARVALHTQYSYTESARKQLLSPIHSTSNNHLPTTNSNHSTAKYSEFKLSLPNVEKRHSEFRSGDGTNKPPKSPSSPRLGTFNPEGKHREDYEEIILSPRYDSRPQYASPSHSCDLSPLEASKYSSPRTTLAPRGESLLKAKFSQNCDPETFMSNNDAHPRPPPRQHFRSYSAGDYIERSDFLDVIIEDPNPTALVTNQPKPLPRTKNQKGLSSASSDHDMHDTQSSLNVTSTNQLQLEKRLEGTENNHFKPIGQDHSFCDTQNRYAVEFPLTNVTNSLYKFSQASLSEQITFENTINDFPPVS